MISPYTTFDNSSVNINRAAELIQSFKQVAVDQTSAERRRFDVTDYIREVLRSLGPRLKRTPHDITVEGPDNLEVEGYPGALSQVLTNFVINSISHGYDEGQRGKLNITVTQPSADRVELRYSDDGRGIPASDLGRVFDPFFTTARGLGGSGLGLNIVYNIVSQTLAGTIDVQSEPGRGTTFVVQFPRKLAAQKPDEFQPRSIEG